MKNRTYAHERTHGEFHVHVDVDVDVDQSFDMNNSQSAKSSDANTTVAGTANVDASFRRILLDSSSIAFDCDESRNETSHTECEYETSQGGAGIEANTSANVNVNANNNIPFDVHNDNDDNASDDGPGPGPGPGPRNEETAEENVCAKKQNQKNYAVPSWQRRPWHLTINPHTFYKIMPISIPRKI